MRIGAPLKREFYHNPDEWVAALRERRYSAAYCPVSEDADPSEVADYREAARSGNIIIAEVGIWRNMIHQDENLKREHIDECSPGEGYLEHGVFLEEAEALNPDLPLMLEHMKTDEQYRQKADYLRWVAAERGITPV